MLSARSAQGSRCAGDYVEAAVALDSACAHHPGEFCQHVIFVAITLFAAPAPCTSRLLIFLGMAPINDYTWRPAYSGHSRHFIQPGQRSMVLSPVIAIALFQVCMVLFARSLEELFDPRLRTSK